MIYRSKKVWWSAPLFIVPTLAGMIAGVVWMCTGLAEFIDPVGERARTRTETGTQVVLTEVFRSVRRCCHATNSELAPGRFVFCVLNRSVGKMHMCYVKRVPWSAGLGDRAQLWWWGSQWSRTRGSEPIKALLSPWPVERPANWAAHVNAPMTAKELDRVRVSIVRGRRYGEEKWVRETAKDLGLEQTVLRPEGRPRKASQSATQATS